ncbi:AEC family transporter [Aliibacillus thermotolerans]|uniref:AEC family transporter n=1 Tax=Aliibacillus thermotolerans TaxID=1834418 RepID=A0ABW0U841_9BACI|nr:AEC family transporter [Aliibacillus thermotolerans]MDA3130232.1 AEC family transporter [Aliibacillus thermotolerans]
MLVLIDVLIPIVLIFLVGFWLEKKQVLDVRSVSAVALYVLTPTLVFRTFYTTEINADLINIVLFCVLFLIAFLILNKLLARMFQWNRKKESGMTLATTFMNSGNYGAPLILFAFGEVAFAYAIIFMVVQSLLMSTAGVYLANRSNLTAADALRVVLKMPVFHALLIGVIFQWLNISIKDTYFDAIHLLADAAIPVVMIVLGMQLANISLHSLEWKTISIGTVMRLGFSPIIAYAITLLLQPNPTLSTVMIVSASMPTAATIAMISVEFDASPDIVSSITLVTTIMSVPSLWLLLTILGG